jgi:hypothetical protein
MHNPISLSIFSAVLKQNALCDAAAKDETDYGDRQLCETFKILSFIFWLYVAPQCVVLIYNITGMHNQNGISLGISSGAEAIYTVMLCRETLYSE